MTYSQNNPVWQVEEPAVMDIVGRLDAATAPEVAEDVRLCIESGARDMVLDCSRLRTLTGAGVRGMVDMARVMQAHGGQLRVSGLNGQPMAMFEACGLDSIIGGHDRMIDVTRKDASRAA